MDFLDVDIEDDEEVIDLVQGDPALILKLLDLKAIKIFIEDWNLEYCNDHDLCPECRSPLVEMFVDVPYGDTIVQELEGLSCPSCRA